MNRDIGDLYRTATAQAAEECAARRARVLAHPDLAELLVTDLGYARPAQWNGYVPPRIINPGPSEALFKPGGNTNRAGHRTAGEQENDSPRRAILIAICREAWRREQETTTAEVANELTASA